MTHEVFKHTDFALNKGYSFESKQLR